MSDSSLKIVVASHKPYWIPNDSLYLPVQAGAAGKASIEGFQRDDDGDNISVKNPRYCELTVLYWAWKNLDADSLGLAHYRRHFAGSGEKGTLSTADAERLLSKNPVILPRKRHYVIETVGNHYAHTFEKAHLDAVREALSELSPEMIPAFEAHMAERSSHIWNMAIMRSDIMEAWCSWLFPFLAAVEKRIDFTNMTPFQERVIGRLSERLLDPWLVVERISYNECPIVALEGEDIGKKAIGVLQAKFLGKKYEGSF